jgi:protein-S-isoprenylcysteine O-methyltransferase Ste14
MRDSTIVAVLAGVLAFSVAFLFDWVSIRKIPYIKLAVVFSFLGLHGYALFAALWGADQFLLPAALSILGWVMLPVFAFLLVYSLAIELPSGKTYSQSGTPTALVTTGTYALSRHPGVIWYVLALGSLLLAIRSSVLLIAAPVWALLNIIYASVQDRFFFVKMFPEYQQYRQQTPMFIPTRKSIFACLRTLRAKPYHAAESKTA